MYSKILIACALLVAVQASGYGHTQIGGYVAKPHPRATLQILPSYHNAGYGSGYGGWGGYGGYGGHGGYGHLSAYNPAVIGAAHSVLPANSLAKLALSLPPAGPPNPALLYVPKHSITTYNAPAAVLSYGGHGGHGGLLSSQTAAAAAASSVKSARSGYGPAQAHVGYGYGGVY